MTERGEGRREARFFPFDRNAVRRQIGNWFDDVRVRGDGFVQDKEQLLKLRSPELSGYLTNLVEPRVRIRLGLGDSNLRDFRFAALTTYEVVRRSLEERGQPMPVTTREDWLKAARLEDDYFPKPVVRIPNAEYGVRIKQMLGSLKQRDKSVQDLLVGVVKHFDQLWPGMTRLEKRILRLKIMTSVAHAYYVLHAANHRQLHPSSHGRE